MEQEFKSYNLGITWTELSVQDITDLDLLLASRPDLTPQLRSNIICLWKRHPDRKRGPNFTILPVEPRSVVLQEYVNTGSRLKNSTSSGMVTIEAGVTDFVNSVKQSPRSRPVVFAFLCGSSGLGKTQLAFALHRKVLYVPLGNSQEVYRCFNGLSVVLAQTIAYDQHVLRAAAATKCTVRRGTSDFSADYIMQANSRGGPIRFRTVQLMLEMLKIFNEFPPTAASYNTNVFLGVYLPVELEGTTIAEGRAAAEKYNDVLIHLDDVPTLDSLAQEPFFQCLLLRNIIRCMGLPCLLSGTESSLLAVAHFGQRSGQEGTEPCVWLLTKFPATELSEQLTVLTNRCRNYEKHVLQTTRPLFVQWFTHCHKKGLTGTDAAGHIRMTPATLTGLKVTMCQAKLFLPDPYGNLNEDYERPWLHASTLLVFADSLPGSGAVCDTVTANSIAQIGEKRPASSLSPSVSSHLQQRIAVDDQYHHTLVIRTQFALLHIPPSVVVNNNMTTLHVDSDLRICNSNGEAFTAKATFKTCMEDPLLYLACLRNGIVRRVDGVTFVPVPSSYAFSTFGEKHSVGNNGTSLYAEGMTALVLSAHRYETFTGTPFFGWLALVVAELSCERDFKLTEITDIPIELDTALKEVMVPLLSPPNSPWGDSTDSGINFGSFSWCKNQMHRNASAPPNDRENDVGRFPFVAGTHGYAALGAEIKDVKGFGGKNMIAVTKKVAENSVGLLVGRDLCDWEEETVQKFAQDVSVYRMNQRGAIVHVSPPVADWEAGRKVLIALDLKRLHPGRSEALVFST